jgi:hypothetical protein
MKSSALKVETYPRHYVRRETVVQKYCIDNVLAADKEYEELVAYRKIVGTYQMEHYRAPYVRGCGLPAEQKRKRNKWNTILMRRAREVEKLHKKYRKKH